MDRTIARTDSPELAGHWTRPATSFDAEDAPDPLAKVFDAVTVDPWDAPLVTLPGPAAIRDYLTGGKHRPRSPPRLPARCPFPFSLPNEAAGR
ncbi:hypothetical protein EEB14_36545 [Rhodococcus sp. WS4]|nr:hypothetical protein EEB14_36545 [Rhodococcus sp. WS4]